MWFDVEESFFFEQTSYRRPVKRYKKTSEELPQALRFAHLNPKIASFYSKEDRQSDSEAVDAVKQDSLLPDIANAFATLTGQLIPDYDSQRYQIEQSKKSAPDVLEQLSRLLPLLKNARRTISLPRSLDANLQCSFDDLVYDARYVKREWQLAENQLERDAALKAKSEKDLEISRVAAENEKKSKPEQLSDSEDEAAFALQKDTDSKPRRHSRNNSNSNLRNSKSQPAVILEETANRGQPKKSRGGSGVKLKPTTAPVEKRHLDFVGRHGTSKGDDGMSEAGFSVKCGRSVSAGAINSHPQPYSMTVLNFNLANYHSMEGKGCSVYGIDRTHDDDHPLEWVVKRLNRAMKIISQQQKEAKAKNLLHLPYTRYYDDNFNEKHLHKSASEKLGIFNTVMKGGKPRIPNLPKKNKKQPLCVQLNDGSRTVYYDNGFSAIISSYSGSQGYYTNVYDKDNPACLLASFTPTGNGCCYYPNGAVKLLLHSEGGLMMIDEDETEEWKWPSDKLSQPITTHLNKNMFIKVVSQTIVTLTFVTHTHTIKFSIGKIEGSVEPSSEDLFPMKLVESVTYTSNTAKELIQKSKDNKFNEKVLINKKNINVKAKPNKSKEDNSRRSVDFSEETATTTAESKLEKEFIRLKNKAKNMVDDWMDIYRLALGIASPNFKHMKCYGDTHKRIGGLSAKSLPARFLNSNFDDLATTPIPEMDKLHEFRAPSAPSGVSMWSSRFEVPMTRLSARERNSANTLKTVHISVADDEKTDGETTEPISALSAEWRAVIHNQCPVSLRQQLLGHSAQSCRCARRKIPYITDVELDTFISIVVPNKQLIVISVVSSLYPQSQEKSSMLDHIYAERNGQRSRICMQSRSDSFRIFRYDVATSHFDSNLSQPLLLTRHNAVPGMFLIYQGGKLIFCDHIFNGYGNAKKDFQKQLINSRNLAHRGFVLPKDFKFSPQKGKQGPRSPWGGQIGGAGVDKYGHPGTDGYVMPVISNKDRRSSLESTSSLEYHLGRAIKTPTSYDNSKQLVSKIHQKAQKYMRINSLTAVTTSLTQPSVKT